ncbi:MAG: hypothetical protein KDD50_14865 [Bdellovibrionales bacterium]|nr:hypothetical protein [Bdellovibrionales bacterium]
MKKRILLLTFFIFLSFEALANKPKASEVVEFEGSSLISFNSWKNEQVIINRNAIARIKNWLYFVKKGSVLETVDPVTKEKINLSAVSLEEKASRIKRTEGYLKQLEKDLEIAEELSFEDYLAVYVSHLGKNKEKLKLLAAKLSEEEIVELLLYIQRQGGAAGLGGGERAENTGMTQSILNY